MPVKLVPGFLLIQKPQARYFAGKRSIKNKLDKILQALLLFILQKLQAVQFLSYLDFSDASFIN